MSYMDRDNIINEGILDNILKALKKITAKGMLNLDPEYRKSYKKALKHAKDAQSAIDRINKRKAKKK